MFPVAHYFARRSLDRATFASPLLLDNGKEDRKNGGARGSKQTHHNGGGGNGHGHEPAARPPQTPPPPSSIHLDALLGLEGFTLTDDGGAAGAAGPTSDPSRPRPPVLKATARVRVTGRLCNNFNTLHGGAVSILVRKLRGEFAVYPPASPDPTTPNHHTDTKHKQAERMAARVWASARRMAGWEGAGAGGEGGGEGAGAEWPHARTLSIDYMSPAPKGCEVVLEAWAAPLGPSPAPSPWPGSVPAAAAAIAGGMAYPPLSGEFPRGALCDGFRAVRLYPHLTQPITPPHPKQRWPPPPPRPTTWAAPMAAPMAEAGCRARASSACGSDGGTGPSRSATCSSIRRPPSTSPSRSRGMGRRRVAPAQAPSARGGGRGCDVME